MTKHSIGNPYSGSLDNVAHAIWAPLTENRLLSIASLAVRGAVGGVAVVVGGTRRR